MAKKKVVTEQLNVRLPEATIKRAKAYCAKHGVLLRDFVAEAIASEIQRRTAKHETRAEAV